MINIKFGNENITTNIEYNEESNSWDVMTTQKGMMDKFTEMNISPRRVLKNEDEVITLAMYNLKLEQIVFINITDSLN